MIHQSAPSTPLLYSMSARLCASGSKEMRRHQYDDPDLRKKLECDDMSDYAVYCEDTYLCHDLYDLLVLRAIDTLEKPFDPWTHLQSISRAVEMRLKENYRYHALLNHMYIAAGRQGLPSSLWANYGSAQGALRPGDRQLLSTGSMVAYLVMSAPASGIKVIRPHRSDLVHTLRRGDVMLCREDDLEILGDGCGLEICYMLTMPYEAPAKVLAEPIFSSQLLNMGGFIEAMFQARQEHQLVVKPVPELISYAPVDSFAKSEIPSPLPTPSYLDAFEPTTNFDPAGSRPATPPLDPSLVFDASSGRVFPALPPKPTSTPHFLHALPAKPQGGFPAAVGEYEMAPHVLLASRMRW